MAGDDPQQSRPLGRVETALALSDENGPFNMVAVLRLAPAPDASLLRAALGHLQRRHPALRARIERQGRRRRFVYDVTEPVPLDLAAGGDWTQAAEDALNAGLPAAAGPLAAAVLVAGESSADLVIRLPHTVVDAASAASLFGELLERYAALSGGADPEPGPSLPVPVAVDDLFPPGYRGARLRARRLGFTARQLPGELRYRRAMRQAGGPSVRPGARSILHFEELDAATTAALGPAARRRRVTLNSVIQAALLLAIHRRTYDGRPLPLRTMSLADLRPYLAAPVPAENLACYWSPTVQDVAMDGAADLWEVARRAQEQVDASVRGGAKFVAADMSVILMRTTFAAKLRMGNAALSHTGATPLQLHYGPLELTGLHGFVSNLAVGPEVSMRTGVFAGRLILDFMALDTDMDRSELGQIGGDVHATLAGAAAGD